MTDWQSDDAPLQRWGLLTRWMQRRRLAVASAALRPPVLDYGCGSHGAMASLFAPEEYLGVDRLAAARRCAAAANPAHEFLSPEELGDRRFNTVASLAVIEHVPRPREFVAELVRHLRPGGRLVLTTPSPHSERLHDFGARMNFFSHAAADQHEALLSLPELESLLVSCGLEDTVSRRFMGGFNQLIVGRLPSGSDTNP